MSYIDGFVLPVPENKLEEYKSISSNAGKVWMEHGALDYKESVIDDGNVEAMGMRPFSQVADAKAGEVIVFAYILYKDRAHRDEVNAKVMADPRIQCDPNNMPFDCKRMAYGGFRVFVDAKQ